MPQDTTTEDRYGDRFLAGLVKEAFDRIVYTGINHFDQVFDELDWIATGSTSTMLPELSDLFNNEYQVLEVDDLGWPKAEQRAALQQLFKDRVQAEQDAYFPLPNRIEKLDVQTKQRAAKAAKGASTETAPELPRFPSAAEAELMQTYEIPENIGEPEFRVCVAIAKLREAIDPSVESNAIPEALDFRIRVIYNALNMPHEANLIGRNLRTDLYRFNNIKELLQLGVVTAKQFRRFDPEIRSYLALHGTSIADEVPIRISDQNLMVYIQGRKILSDFNPNIDFSNLARASMEARDSEEKALGSFRRRIVALFAEHCDLTISASKSDKEIYCLLHELLAIHITKTATWYNIPLPAIYALDEVTIIKALSKCRLFTSLIIDSATPPQQLLTLSTEALDKLLNNGTKVRAQCAAAGLSLKEFLAMPNEILEFLLAEIDDLDKMAMVLKSRTVTKEQFLAADLNTMQAWFKHASANIHYIFALMAAPEKDYEAIIDYFAGLEFVTNSGQSAYAFALTQNDPALIDVITRSILQGYSDCRRAIGYLHGFLCKNKFKTITPQPTENMQWLYHQSTVVSDKALNARNADGDTPLLVAIKQNDYKAALCLIVSGADISLTGKDGLRPLELARNLGRAEMVQDLAQTERYLGARQGARVAAR